MKSRNQYLQELRKDYLKSQGKRERGRLLDEACQRTSLNRKYLIRKLKPKSNLDKIVSERKKRHEYYDGYVTAALVRVWEIFDCPCGQRLAPQLQDTNIIDHLRDQGELECSDIVACKLKHIGSSTIDEKLRHEKEVRRLRQEKDSGYSRSQSLLLQKIPIKVHSELDTVHPGTVEVDFVEHCGQSAQGEFVCTLDTMDIVFGWQEWEAQMGRGMRRTREGLNRVRSRSPIPWLEIHPDNDTSFINHHVYEYAHTTNLAFSRSRPYKKNDNAFIEGRNWFSVRKRFGYRRFDRVEELNILNDLYRNELRLYHNFFQPLMRLKEKIRIGSKVKRRYERAKTPYQRILESDNIPTKIKDELRSIYQSLNPVQLKRSIDQKLERLYQAYEVKTQTANINNINPYKKLKPQFRSVTFYPIQREGVRLPR